MMASMKIKRERVRESRARKPKECPEKRIMDVTVRHQMDASSATSYVSLPREPWDREADQ